MTSKISGPGEKLQRTEEISGSEDAGWASAEKLLQPLSAGLRIDWLVAKLDRGAGPRTSVKKCIFKGSWKYR